MQKLDSSERLAPTFIFIIVIGLLGLDIHEDLQGGSSLEHVLKESLIVAFGLGGILSLWYKYFTGLQDQNRLKLDLIQAQEDLAQFREETKHLTQGFSVKIDEQLGKWKLTPAEKDVAILIIKGLTNKEIAEVRKTSEKTIRQQATSIYQKSNLSSRNELSAFFLEDLLAPITA